MKCDCQEDLGRLIYMTGQNLRNFAEKVMAPFSVTLEQFQILKCLALADIAMSQRQIGSEVAKNPANITRILDRLENKELLRRSHDPDDRRATLVALTHTGARLVEKVSGIFDSFSENLVAGISDAEKQVMRSAFKQIAENILDMSKKI